MKSFYTNAIQSDSFILLRGYDNGVAFTRKEPYSPTLFIRGDATSKWHSIYGAPLEPIEFSKIRDAKDFIKKYENVDGFDLFGLPRFVYSFLNEKYPDSIEFNSDLIKIVTLDIEVGSENGFPNVDTASEEITAITIKKNNHFYVFGCGDFFTERADITYHKCRNEKSLLMRFIEEWSRGGYPDIITGWNINYFDIPYLIRRIASVLDDYYVKKLSPWNFYKQHETTVMGRKQTSITIAGISSLDYIELYKKFTYSQQESYRLDHIASVELGTNKIDYSEYDSLHKLYEQNFQKFIEYNIRDVEIVDSLEDKMKLINMAITLAYDAKVNYQDVFTQVRMWDTLIHNELWKDKIAVPITSRFYKEDAYEGAYVKEPQVGLHRWILSFDLNSLYPSLIMQYNISPEMISNKKIDISVNNLLDKNYDVPKIEGLGLASNGWYFKNEKQGFLPRMMQRMYEDRAIYKNKMIEAQKDYEKETDVRKKKSISNLISRYKNLQLAKKVQLNSAYGAIGNPHFRFFDLRQATAITLGGQLAIRWAENEINDYMNSLLKTMNKDYVLASDTDSLYINFDPLVSKVFKDLSNTEKIITFLDDVAKNKMEPFIDQLYQDLAVRTNSFQQKMIMKREVIANRGIWTAKKRYILNVFDSEGVRYDKPKLKVMGVESVKSSTPASCRVAIKDALYIIMNKREDDLQEYIRSFKKTFNTLPFEDIAFPRGLQNLDLYENNPKGVPIHVRGAICYNALLREKKLTKKYQLIKEGEKVKFCYLRMPNTIHENVFSILTQLPKEFDLSRYIDYPTQFEKAFMQPLRSILAAIDWSEEKRNTIEDFFT